MLDNQPNQTQPTQQRKCGRREFLNQTLARVGATSLAASALAGGIAGHAKTARAIEPLKRSAPQFKFSLAAYSYRNLLQGDNPKLTLFDFVDDCARFGLEGTELTSYYFPKPLTDEYLYRLRAHCFRQGLDVSGTAVGNDFGFAPGDPKRDQQIKDLKGWIDKAQRLGAPVIRIFAGKVKSKDDPGQVHAWMVSAIEECCSYAGQRGIHLALENHGGPTSTAAGLLSLVKDVDSPWFGVNLDSGNFHSDDVYAELAEAAPYAVNVQVKVVVSGPDGKKRPTDFNKLADILRAANYRGYVVLEYEEDGNPRTESERYADQLRAAFSA